MKRFLQYPFLVYFLLFSFHYLLVAQDLEILKQVGGSGSVGAGNTIRDSAGNHIVCFSFNGEIDFNLGNTPSVLNTSGYANLAIAKYDSSYNLLWIKQLVSDSVIRLNRVVLDNNENIIISGSFTKDTDFNPSENEEYILSVSSNYSLQSFILKLDNNGSFIWARKIVDSNLPLSFSDIQVDEFDNLIFGIRAVLHSTNLTFIENNESIILNSNSILVKLDPNGNLIEYKQFDLFQSSGVIPAFLIYRITKDLEENYILTGIFQGIVDFDPDSNTSLDSLNGSQTGLFVLKLNSNLQFSWVKIIKKPNNAFDFGAIVPLTINVNQVNEIIITGRFGGSYGFNSTDPNFIFTAPISYFDQNVGFSLSETNSFIISYNSFGSLSFAKHLVSETFNTIRSATSDSLNNIFISGTFKNQINLNVENSGNILNALGESNTYIAKYNLLGDLIWYRHFPFENLSLISSLRIDNQNRINFSGVFEQAITFNPENITLNSVANDDSFLGRFSIDNNTNIDKYSNNLEVLIYPNPANNIVSIKTQDIIVNAKIEVFSISGQLQLCDENKTGQLIEMNISNLSKGIYFIRMTDKNKTYTGRFVK